MLGMARSGATCSNNLTYRPFPPIKEWQLPTYLNETYNGTLHFDPEETMYTIWIGTNDLGVNALLTGSDAPDVSIVQVRQCAVDVVKILYENGVRNFIMQNVSISCFGLMVLFVETGDVLLDASPRSHYPVLQLLVPQQVLDRAAQHYGMECLHERTRPWR
jgi:hypothetical protein